MITMQTKKILNRIKLINWHYFNNQTINLKNVNLFSGENGAGKSTILDAIQLILTTNSKKFNLAANTDSRRNLKTYVRGKTGEEGNEYLRNGAVISYVALEIYEESRERYFVLGVKIDSPDLESEPKKKWFCEEGTLDGLSFVTDNKPSKDEYFKNNGKKVSFIQQVSGAKDRFGHRLGHLQESFFELLPKSMAFTPMKDVKSFVTQYILPQKDVDTSALSENIRNLDEMQKLVDELMKQAKDLEEILNSYDGILRIDEQIRVIDILIKISQLEANIENIDNKHAQIKLKEQSKYQNEKLYDEIESDIKSLSNRHSDILVSLKNGETALMIASIRNEIKSKQKDADIASEGVKKLKDQIKRITAAYKYMSDFLDLNVGSYTQLDNSETDIEQRNLIVSEIEKSIQSANDSFSNQRSDVVSQLKSLNNDIEKLSREIRDLELNKITYDRNVLVLKEAVEHEFKTRGINSEVRVLADLLEVTDEKWQNAVEGYLNTQRFHIIVEPQYYDIAAAVYDRHRSKIHTAAIVNTSKLKTNLSVDDNSLASVVVTENIYARAYVGYLLGRVTMCDNVSQLKEYDIAITQGCMLYQGKALRKINPDVYRMPYIGKYAREQQLKIKKTEYDNKTKEKDDLESQNDNFDSALRAINNCNVEILKEVVDTPIKLKNTKSEINVLEAELKEAENEPTYLQLQMEEEKISKQIDDKRKEQRETGDKVSLSKHEIQQLSNEIQELEKDNIQIKENINELSRGYESALAEANKKFDEHKKTKSAGTIFGNYQPRRTALINQKTDSVGKLTARQASFKSGELGTGLEMMPAYIEAYDELTKHDLISYEEKLRTIKDNCETEFRESFLAKMRENIEKAIAQFKELNKTLKPIYYGNDSYRFDWSPNIKKKRLYDMIMSDFNLGGFNLFSTQFDEQYHDEMNELFAKLTVSDEKGDDVLREYTDYRSYLDYDIDIVSKDGRTQKFSKIYREKSGGETQTPYYVAIAASFAQIYSIGETIRLIMLDEAFDKMDEDRIKSMLEFFKTQNFQVILAAPTSRLELIGEQTDNIIMIYSDTDHNSFAEEFSYDEI